MTKYYRKDGETIKRYCARKDLDYNTFWRLINKKGLQEKEALAYIKASQNKKTTTVLGRLYGFFRRKGV